MNLSRLIILCVLLVSAWILQVMGLFHFVAAIISGPPEFQIVDFDKLPAEGLLFEPSQEYVSQDFGDERVREFHREKWLWLFAGILGIVVTFTIALRIFESTSLALSAVISCPIHIAFYFARNRGR